jgi:predicted amidophosphoribosyltransferase
MDYIVRQKLCEVCGKDWKTMYRIIYKEGADWVFVCKHCLLEIKKKNPHYKYGGTWKR